MGRGREGVGEAVGWNQARNIIIQCCAYFASHVWLREKAKEQFPNFKNK